MSTMLTMLTKHSFSSVKNILALEHIKLWELFYFYIYIIIFCLTLTKSHPFALCSNVALQSDNT